MALQFFARQKIRRLILDRWEKRWNDGQQTYYFIDTWAEKASASKSNYWAEEDDDPYVAPPWDIKSQEPPLVLRKRQFNPHATPDTTMGTPRGAARKVRLSFSQLIGPNGNPLGQAVWYASPAFLPPSLTPSLLSSLTHSLVPSLALTGID